MNIVALDREFAAELESNGRLAAVLAGLDTPISRFGIEEVQVMNRKFPGVDAVVFTQGDYEDTK